MAPCALQPARRRCPKATLGRRPRGRQTSAVSSCDRRRRRGHGAIFIPSLCTTPVPALHNRPVTIPTPIGLLLAAAVLSAACAPAEAPGGAPGSGPPPLPPRPPARRPKPPVVRRAPPRLPRTRARPPPRARPVPCRRAPPER